MRPKVWRLMALCVLAGVAVCRAQEAPQEKSDWQYVKPSRGPLAMALEYRGTPVPEVLCRKGARITIPIGTFFYGKEEKSGALGWWPYSKDTPLGVMLVPPSLQMSEASLGFYCADFKGRRITTPAHWVFVEINGVGYWADPGKLDRFSEQILTNADLREERFR